MTEEAKDNIRRQPWLAGFFIRKAREDVEKLLSSDYRDYVPFNLRKHEALKDIQNSAEGDAEVR